MKIAAVFVIAFLNLSVAIFYRFGSGFFIFVETEIEQDLFCRCCKIEHSPGVNEDCFCGIHQAAHSDLSRIIAQQKFISEQNWQMTLPMQWEMYGDGFELRRME